MTVNYPTGDDIQHEADGHIAIRTIEKLEKLTPVAMKWKYSGVTGPGPGEPRCQNFHGWPQDADPESGKVAVIHLWFEEPDLDPTTGDEREHGWGAGLDMPLGQAMFAGDGSSRKTVDQALTALLDGVNRTFIQVSMRITQNVEGLLAALPGVVLSGLLAPVMEGRALTRAQFIEQFEASFLAAWAARNYGPACDRGDAGDLMERAPYEDVAELAEQAWNLKESLR